MEDPLLRDAGGMANGTAKSDMTVAVEDAALAASAVPVDAAPVKTVREAWDTFMAESARLWLIAMPIAFQILCVYGINSATQIFVGHLSNLELSAVAISLSVISNFSFGFLLGMGSALETLCGQAFGAGQVEMLGIYMQRSWIILFASACIMCPFYIFATPILKLIGQEDDIAEAAGRFTILIIPEIFSLALNFPTQKFLQAQSKVSVLAYIGFFTLILHVGLLYLFIYVFGWGLTGAAVAFDISMWVVAIAQTVYVIGWCKEGWTGLSWAAFNDIWAFVRLSFASAVMLCLEIWYMMVLVVLTGHLHNAEIAVGSLSICLAWGVHLRLCGQALGAGQVEMLGIYMQRSWIILFASACIMCPFYIFAAPILKFIGQEDDIAEAAGRFTIHIIPEAGAKKGEQVSWAAFNDIWTFVSLSFASAVMLCLEIWCMMVLVVLTGHLHNAEIAVDSLSICMNISEWEIMLFIGINAAISVRVSNELGTGRARGCKHAVVVAVVTSLVIGLLAMVIILGSRSNFSMLFTSDKEMQRAVAKIAYLLAVTMVLNSIQLVISGVAIGGGWQGLVAYINLGCYYVFGLPFGFLLGYPLHLGVQGIWIGMLCGILAQTLILLFILLKTNWKDEASQASERVRLWGGQNEPTKSS